MTTAHTAINKDIEALAAQMGVSYADVACLANSVANSMAKDKIKAEDIPADMRIDVSLAYVQDAVRKFENFRAAYHEPHGRNAFIRTVFALSAGGAA